MAGGNIFRYTILSLFIFCCTKMLYFIKESRQSYSKYLPVDRNAYMENFKEPNAPFLQKESNMSKNVPEINELATQQNRNFIMENTKRASNIKLTLLTNNDFKRKRKLLIEMWDNNDKVQDTVSFEKQGQMLNSFSQVGNDIFVYSVFHDDRQVYNKENPVLQIVTISKLQSNLTLMCQFCENTGDDQWVTAVKHELSDNHGRLYGGVLYTCNIPKILCETPQKAIHLQSRITHDDIPSKVTSTSVTVKVIWLEISNWKSAINQDTYNLKNSKSEQQLNFANSCLETVHKSKELEKKNKIEKSKISSPVIAKGRQLDLRKNKKHEGLFRTKCTRIPSVSICVPPLFGNIKLSEFIQFVEIHKILGASQIFFYKMNVSSDIETMLNYYQSQGLVTVYDWILPKELQVYGNIWNNGQIATQQDCLYRNMGKYDYTAFIDLDEVIVPNYATNWQQMLKKLERNYTDGKNRNAAAFIFKSAFFKPYDASTKKTDMKQEKLLFLNSLYRNEIISLKRSKMIVKPSLTEFIGIHHVSKFVNTNLILETVNIPVNTALIHHYRKCTEALDTEMFCGQYVTDKSLLKYGETLMKNYEKALDENMRHFKTIK